MSDKEFVFISKCNMLLNFRMLGKILYSYFSARVSFVLIIQVLSADLDSPERDPLSAYYNFFISSYLFARASYSNFFLYSYRAFSYSYLCFCSSSSCYAVFYGAGCSTAATYCYSDIVIL